MEFSVAAFNSSVSRQMGVVFVGRSLVVTEKGTRTRHARDQHSALVRRRPNEVTSEFVGHIVGCHGIVVTPDLAPTQTRLTGLLSKNRS